MDIEQLAIAQQKTEDRSVRNEGRIKKLEEDNKALNTLATAVAVMGEKMQNMTTSVDTLSLKVTQLEAVPARRWDAVVAAVIAAVIGGVIGHFII